MIYLASPYSHSDPFIREYRYLSILELVTKMLKEHQYVYSPIVHNHEIGKMLETDGSASFDFWSSFDFHMIELCENLTVAMLPGWEESRGVTAEIAYARELGKSVLFLNRARYLQ